MSAPHEELSPLMSLSELIAYLESLGEPTKPRVAPRAGCMRDQIVIVEDDYEALEADRSEDSANR